MLQNCIHFSLVCIIIRIFFAKICYYSIVIIIQLHGDKGEFVSQKEKKCPSASLVTRWKKKSQRDGEDKERSFHSQNTIFRTISKSLTHGWKQSQVSFLLIFKWTQSPWVITRSDVFPFLFLFLRWDGSIWKFVLQHVPSLESVCEW